MKGRSHESGGDLRRVRGDEDYFSLSNDKVKQSVSSKVNAVLHFKWNNLDSGTQFNQADALKPRPVVSHASRHIITHITSVVFV